MDAQCGTRRDGEAAWYATTHLWFQGGSMRQRIRKTMTFVSLFFFLSP